MPPNLRKIEQNIEAEISDLLSESWDDSTTLRRDALFAELVLQLDKMIIRFVDDDEVSDFKRRVGLHTLLYSRLYILFSGNNIGSK